MKKSVFLIAGLVAATVTPALAEQVTVTVKREDCANVVAYVPAADVAFKPGVDVNGNAVAPADLNGGSQLKVPEEITIPIEIDLQERFGWPATKGLYKGDAQVGSVTYRDGKT